ncbi:membrane protein [Shewanella sp. NFH-SH190041]|uniref:lipopolysaccharide biosynthesis protein n=1 Tax=Shewanella sp. NFH-SH190041 TaxID=2950245 RepID=UPI0021C3B354|nr:hypothetical protein [Shewanella sp. NFH-SH190041]BDM64822.1 membrane protein [Shewanella sp. NFH-SH190041]
MSQYSISALKRVFIQGIGATLLSIALGYGFKIYLAQWVARDSLALYHTVVDVITLALIVMTGFRSAMVVSYARTRNDRDIINLFRFCLIAVVLLTWGLVLPYIKHRLHMNVAYWQLVGIILSMGLKIYFTNQLAMYRMYGISNRITWLDPALQILLFALGYGVLGMSPLSALFHSLIIGNFLIAVMMFISRRRQIRTHPLQGVMLSADLKQFMQRSMTASLETGASMLMIYLMVLLTVRYFSLEELGNFQVVVRPVITYMTLLFVFPIYRFVLPELAEYVRQQNYAAIAAIKRLLYRFAFAVSAVFFLLMLFWGRQLVHWLYPAEYHGAAIVLIHFAAFFVLMILNAFQLAFIKAHNGFMPSLLIRISGLVSLLAAFYLLRQYSGNVVSVILALGCGYGVMFILSGYYERRLLARTPAAQHH